MAIYTKKGDRGETRVFNKKPGELVPVSKESCQIQSIGDIDGLNSYLGIIRSEMINEKLGLIGKKESKNKYAKKIKEIQENLFVINSILAGGSLRFPKTKAKKLEKEIDEWEGSLPVQKNFIFYGGSKISSHIFYARALCRRSERSLVSLSKEKPVAPQISSYINRLSDYLFMLGRKLNFDQNTSEENWISAKKK